MSPDVHTHKWHMCSHMCSTHRHTSSPCRHMHILHTHSHKQHTCSHMYTSTHMHTPPQVAHVFTHVYPPTHISRSCTHTCPHIQAVHVLTHAHPSHIHTYKWHVLTMCAPQHQTQVAHRQPEREEEAGFSSQERASLPGFEIRYLGGWCCAHI